jgi:hypothetical protein
MEKKRREDNGLRIERGREKKERWRFGRWREEAAKEERIREMWLSVLIFLDSGLLIWGFVTDGFTDGQLNINIFNFFISVSVCKV